MQDIFLPTNHTHSSNPPSSQVINKVDTHEHSDDRNSFTPRHYFSSDKKDKCAEKESRIDSQKKEAGDQRRDGVWRGNSVPPDLVASAERFRVIKEEPCSSLSKVNISLSFYLFLDQYRSVLDIFVHWNQRYYLIVSLTGTVIPYPTFSIKTDFQYWYLGKPLKSSSNSGPTTKSCGACLGVRPDH